VWKSFEELEECLSLPELFSALEAQRDKVYNDRKFFAALQGVDLDETEEEPVNTWEDIKARAFSGGKARDAKDILALSGRNAKIKGFGIGNGLEYFNSDDTPWWDE
jgi:hypothetical protein